MALPRLFNFPVGQGLFLRESIFFYALLNGPGKGRQLPPGGGEDFNNIGLQLKPEFFFDPIPKKVFFVLWIG